MYGYPGNHQPTKPSPPVAPNGDRAGPDRVCDHLPSARPAWEEEWRLRRAEVREIAPPPYCMLLLLGASVLAVGLLVQAAAWLG